jgi:hypothetical protein
MADCRSCHSPYRPHTFHVTTRKLDSTTGP